VRIAVTGSHGQIGSALVPALRAAGHDVVRLVRNSPTAPDQVQWAPAEGRIDAAALGQVDGAVNLAGAGVGDKRWTAGYKQILLNSRIQGTRTLATALAAMDPLPEVLVSGSAMGIYGDRGEEQLTEDSPLGDTFLAGLAQQWEAAADPARDAGIRVVHPRTSLVMAASGGAFQPLIRLIRLGLGGPLGNGRQWWSWITLPDVVAALQLMLDGSSQRPEQGPLQNPLEGPVNLASPNPARNAEVIRAVARAFHRPSLLPAPAVALRLVLGEFAGEILASDRLAPVRLQEAGFQYAHPDLESAARWLSGA
jgi:uncharacterized protein (TIGR01777 family)